MKKKLTEAPDELEDKQKERIRKFTQEHYPNQYKKLGRMWGECRDWHLSTGTQRASWEATFRNWIRRAADWEAKAQRKPYWNETPQEPRTKDKGELVPINIALGTKGNKS